MNQVIYYSRGGNTKKLAQAIAKGAGASAQGDVVAMEVTPQLQVSGVDTLFVGGSIYAGEVHEKLKAFLQQLSPEQMGEVKRVVVFSTSAGKQTALAQVKSILEPKGIPVSDKEFHCKGSFLLVNRGRPNADDLASAEAFARENI